MGYLDSRDLEDELQNLEEREDDKDDPLDEEDKRNLKELKELKEECEDYGWDDGICFIPDYMFEDYCRELADDCYSLDKNNPLSNHIDWESWANAVEMDYSEVDFRGTTYKYREA
jgi:hypothetical protein